TIVQSKIVRVFSFAFRAPLSPEAFSRSGAAAPNDSRGCKTTPCHFAKSPCIHHCYTAAIPLCCRHSQSWSDGYERIGRDRVFRQFVQYFLAEGKILCRRAIVRNWQPPRSIQSPQCQGTPPVLQP